MKNVDIEKLLEEAKILYWEEDGKVIFQQNTIGKHDIFKKSENTQEYPVLKLVQEG